MKKILNTLIITCLLTGTFSCQKDFLQKPDVTGNSTVETVFSTTVGAENAIAAAYRQSLVANLWDGNSLNNGILSNVSGEMCYGESWATILHFVSSGFLASPGLESNPAQSTDNFFTNYTAIRKDYLVLQNIDKVTDMDATTKAYVKGEMKGLVAYRYLAMFMRYGGVPLVDKVLSQTDSLNVPRATLQGTLDRITQLCDEAASVLPDKWPDKYAGRLTKGVALAIKAKALIYAARPLFNAATPYLDLGANNKLICFGTADQTRWTNAITANEAVIAWATANGYGIINTGGGTGIANTNAFDDYATATSVASNKEVLLAYKYDVAGNKFFEFYDVAYNNERYLTAHMGMPTNFLVNYYRADGTDQVWPVGVANALPYSDYAAKMQAMEPRFKADNYAHCIDCWNNPGDNAWKYANCGQGQNHNGSGSGDAQSTKYYYKAGSRTWFEYPLYRMPEFYLNLAEAYNETGNTAKALLNLNIVHNRAGLQSVTETDQTKLRKIIQREWAIEFYNENHRYFDVKHWKLDVGNGIAAGQINEFQFTFVPGQTNDRIAANLATYYDKPTYIVYWHPKMFLEPIPQTEIDKGILVQNPGY
jgi:hypothetical protein